MYCTHQQNHYVFYLGRAACQEKTFYVTYYHLMLKQLPDYNLNNINMDYCGLLKNCVFTFSCLHLSVI